MNNKKMYLEGGVIGFNPEYVKDLEEVAELVLSYPKKEAYGDNWKRIVWEIRQKAGSTTDKYKTPSERRFEQ